MRLPKNLALILLAAFLILLGLNSLFSLSFSGLDVVLGLLALAAGALLLLGSGGRLPTKSLGVTLMAVWLILEGLVVAFGLSFSGIDVILGILALAAGALILLGR